MANQSLNIQSSLIENPKPEIFRIIDDRIPVSRPDVFPNRTVGQIVVVLKNGDVYQGSGSLISDYTVLTAGHMVKTNDNKWLPIKRITFIPAKNHLTEPYGRFDWIEMRAVNGGPRDWALLSLAQPAGFRTGFLGSYAKLPISRWVGTRDLSHIGFPGDHRDEMWIDEEGRITRIDEGRQLRTDIDAAAGQSGGPLVRDWFGSKRQVIGALIEGPNPVEDPNDFMPGWETTKKDTWFQWLCDYFGKRHPDDRFGGCKMVEDFAEDDATAMETESFSPHYGVPSFFAEDQGPDIRRFTSGTRSLILTPKRARENGGMVSSG